MKQNKFRIVVPIYNSIQWVEKCIMSINDQKYDNWGAILIDDASTDGTLDKIIATVKEKCAPGKFRVMSRNVNVGALENTIFGTNAICEDDEDIIVIVDGDDWMFDNNVLSYLNEVYQDENIWLTYGNFIYESNQQISKTNKLITNTRTYRHSQNYCSSHLRTYKFKIWKKIQEVDLRDSYGRYYKITGDLAVMYPLIEMSGLNRIKFIEKPLYVYNDINPINDHKKNVKLQIRTDFEIRKKLMYKELP